MKGIVLKSPPRTRLASGSRRKPSSRAFRILSRKTVFRGYVAELDVLRIETSSGRRVEREMIRHPGAVVVIPRFRDGRLILIHQLRVATGRKIWEFPAGTLEKGESPYRCADRELQEETGWKAGRLRKLLSFYPTPGISTEVMHLFLAEDLRKSSGHHCDVDEELEPRLFRIGQLKAMIRSGQIVDGKTILGFLMLRGLSRMSR